MKKPLTLLMFVIFLTCVFYCQEIEVTNPNGYERWELGSIKYITWRSSGVREFQDIPVEGWQKSGEYCP